ncbi:MAG: radical SAM protein [Syntrophobacteraceae bacterium]
MPDILLIQPPIRDFYLTAKRTIPYGLACIAAALIREGFPVEIIDALATGKAGKLELPQEMHYLADFYSGPDISPFSLFHDFRHFGAGFEQIGQICRKSGAFLVGISSLFTAYSDEAMKTAEAVKANCPDTITVLGGHHPTGMPGEVLRHKCVDFIIQGEGEEAMPQLAGALRTGAPLESISGIGFRKGDGGFFLNPPAIVEVLDALPHPAVELIDHKFYRRKHGGSAVIVASRGCPLRCSYCSIGCASWSRFRLKSVSTVIEEMERAVFAFGARFIDFEDENISYERGWFLSLLGEIRNRFRGMGLELRAMNGLFPPSLDETVIRAMKEAGFTALNLSLCTTSRDQLKRFRRPDVREEFERALSCADTYGLETVGYIIAGAPGQEPQDSLSDLLYLASKTVLAGVSVFYPAPGSTDFEKCRKENILPPALSLMRATALPLSGTTTREDAVTLLRLGRVLNFFKSLTPEEKAGLLRPPAGSPEMRGRWLQTHIRHLLDESLEVACASNRDREIKKRRSIGKILLHAFLIDGIIRGVKPEGETYEHRTSSILCEDFREGLLRLIQKDDLSGTGD